MTSFLTQFWTLEEEQSSSKNRMMNLLRTWKEAEKVSTSPIIEQGKVANNTNQY